MREVQSLGQRISVCVLSAVSLVLMVASGAHATFRAHEQVSLPALLPVTGGVQTVPHKLAISELTDWMPLPAPLALAQDQAPTLNTSTITYTIQAGDTLGRLATAYGVTIEELVEWNGIENRDLIYVEQVLVIHPAVTYTVQAGDTLTKLADRYGTTVDELVTWNGIENRDLILEEQMLVVQDPAGGPTTAQAQATGKPLTLKWWVANWWTDDPDYLAAYHIEPEGGTPPYVFYHDGQVQDGDTFEVRWRRCKYRPGSVGVEDATGTYAKIDYWLEAPYCPPGVEIIEPAEGEVLEYYPRHFNIRWVHTVNEPPSEYRIQIQYQRGGEWRKFENYRHRRGESNLFFVPDEFPGDYKGRVRMWGIYGKDEANSRGTWRYFQFRVPDQGS